MSLLKIINPADLPSGSSSRLAVSDQNTKMDSRCSLFRLVEQTRDPTLGDDDLETGVAHLDRILLFIDYIISCVVFNLKLGYILVTPISGAKSSASPDMA
jgi:hypothetical protein